MKIVLALQESEMSPDHLADIVDGSPDAVDRRLKRLSSAGIVAAGNQWPGTSIAWRTNTSRISRSAAPSRLSTPL
ncbi:winged helix-turn-helix domain-containing protein [Streptosporangium sp. CA-115845]|uniref:winged helix-turn-helix domain-containing protein n=1 Tax=Streptosporangium sp. CA-115845 TaxID=3240071 RepID=UPI003D94FF66